MQAYDASWSALPSEGLPGGRPWATGDEDDGVAGGGVAGGIGGGGGRGGSAGGIRGGLRGGGGPVGLHAVGGLHSVSLSPGPDEPVADAPDLMAFLSDFRAAQYEPAPTADESTGDPAADPGASIHWIGGARPAEDDYYDPYEGRTAPAGPGWWQASDHLWYPPELHPDAQAPAEQSPPTDPTDPTDPTGPSDPSAAGAGAAATVTGRPESGDPEAAAGAETDSDRGRGGRLRLGRLGRRG